MKKILLGLVFLVGVFSVAAFAHKGATGIVRERMDGMESMKNAMAVIGGMVTGKTVYDHEEGMGAAANIIDHASRLSDLFPDNVESRQKASQAKEAVWTDNAKFNGLAVKLLDAAAKLELAIDANDRDAMRVNFGLTGKACSACHEGFRKSNQH